jgi:septal ring factor EnvC (AmiA/AmiB activator)
MLGDGHVRDLPGGVPQYLRSRHAASAAGDHPTPGPGGPAAGQPATLAAQVRAARKELARLERRLERLSQLTATLHTQLAAHSTDHVRVSELDTELRAVQRETAELEDAWLEAAAVVQGGG